MSKMDGKKWIALVVLILFSSFMVFTVFYSGITGFAVYDVKEKQRSSNTEKPIIVVEGAANSKCSILFPWWIADGSIKAWPVVHGCYKISAELTASIRNYEIKLIDSNNLVHVKSANSPLFFNFDTIKDSWEIELIAKDDKGKEYEDFQLVYEDDDNDVLLLFQNGGADDVSDKCQKEVPKKDINRDGCQD